MLLGAGFTAFLQGVLGEGPAGPLLQTLRAGFRWSAALFVAFSSSVVVYLGSTAVLLTLVLAFARADRVLDAAAWIAPFGCFSLTGFAGVFCGTLVLEPPSRRIGSWILLAVGLGFYGLAMRNLSYLRASEVSRELPHLWPLAIGGAVAGGWFLWRSSRVASAHTR